MFSKSLYKDHIIFNDNLIGVLNNIPSAKFDKPIYLGMCVLDYSKLLMYQFYYEKINNSFEPPAKKIKSTIVNADDLLKSVSRGALAQPTDISLTICAVAFSK